MDFGDAGNQKGFYTLDLDRMEYDFTPNNISPNYMKISLGELVREGNFTKTIIDRISNNIVKLKVDMNISQEDMDILLKKLNLLRPKNLTVDYDINFNRLIDNVEDKEDLSGIDIPQAIEEFINLLEIENKKDIIDYTLSLYEKSRL
tara:strand:- start:715 stop:1155 length:441 start_codon:yes stop_codon:yes gene_type:complete